MLQYVKSPLFSSPARVLVNTVNTVGVMGKGIALEFKKRNPNMYERYRDLCNQGELEVGKLHLWRTPGRWVLNFPTKRHWRNASRPEWVEAGLKKFAQVYDEAGIDSISFPLLGCGNGRLDFETQVKPLMEKYLRPIPIPIYIHVRYEDADFVAEQEEPDLFSVASEPPTKFADFWRNLRQLAERNPELRLETFTTGSPFRLAYADVDELVFVRESGGRVHIPKGDLRELWYRLRLVGTIKSSDAPGRIGREFSLVFPFLAQLPYVDRVELSDDYEGLERSATGLQLRFSEACVSTRAEVAYG